MTLTSALSKAVQGLNMAARGTDVVSANIANAQTAGYVRRQIESSERVVNGESVGLNPIEIKRNLSTETVSAVRRAQVSFQQQEVISNSLKDIVYAIGDVNSEFSLSARFDTFRASLKNLAETPENGALQDQTITEAKLFAQNINDIAASMQNIRQDADAQILREVDNVNELLHRLKDVNGEIITISGTADVSGLQDEQERIIDQIAEAFPISTTYNQDGSVRISSQTGITLLDIDVTELEFTASAYIPPESIYAYAGEDPGLPFNATLSGLVVGGLDITPTADKIQSLDGGRIGGLFKVRDEETVTIQRQLDSIAARLIEGFRSHDTSLADANTNGTLDGEPDGVPDGDSIFTSFTPGRIFTTVDDMLGIANSFQINSAIDPDQGGDKRRIRDGAEAVVFGPEGSATNIRGWIGQLETLTTFDASTDLTQSQTIMSAVREFVSLASLKSQNEQNTYDYEFGKLNTLIDERDNLQGVNLDNEMNDLVFLQKLYSANAVLMQRAGDMLQTILDLR